jgi:hypothetical protein
MPKVKKRTADSDMLPEYDFSGAIRGKYYERYKASSNIVVLDPDVSEAFPNAEAVNDALRVLASVAKARVTVPGRTVRAKKRPKRMQQTRSASSPSTKRRPRS